MADKVEIVYIGPKDKKKDTVCGTRTIFKRFEPTKVLAEHAERFLSFPTVFVEADKLEEVQKKLEAAEKAAEAKRKAAEEAERQAEEAANMEVIVEGATVDLGKYSSAQLDTFVAAHDLEVEGPKKPVPDYRKKVRDAYRALTAE